MAKCGLKESGTAMFRWRGNRSTPSRARKPARTCNGARLFVTQAKRSLTAAAGLLALCLTLSAQDTPTIRVNVNLVRVIASVKNRQGELVGTLRKEDFELYDNGVRQEIGVFERRTEQPLSIALVMDTSGSTAKEMLYEVKSAQGFLKALLREGNEQDAVALYSFNYDVTLLQNFTRNYLSLERQFKQLRGEGGSSVYDAIYFASRALESREGRKVIVLVTDGGDTTSAHDSHQALKAAQMADLVIYPVVVMPITNDAGRNVGGENALTWIAQGTGGRTFLQINASNLDRAFLDIITELRTQYLLGFYPHGVPVPKNPFHSLEVRTKSGELRVSARNGYYGESESNSGSSGDRLSATPDHQPPEKKKKTQQEK
jgi:Ca-activated chloride channel homolog